MSPETIEVLRRQRLGAALGAALLLAPDAAAAIVGGTTDARPIGRSSVMVLNARGGVCSAVVVAPDVVLTAAHCAAGSSDHRIHYRDAAGATVLVAPAAIKLHPGFSPSAEKTRRRSVDLALLRMPSPLPATFTPAALAADVVPTGGAVTVAGYGVARENDGRSSGTFRSAMLTAVEPHGPSRLLLWAEDRHGGAGACQGDSGGPMTDASGTVVAIVSWASGAGARRCGALTQGVLVGPQRGWIDTTLSLWSRTARWN